MDGKPLYEYARSNLPLPRPIPSRKVTISQIDLLSFTPGEARTDSYEYPKEHLDEKARLEIERLEKMVKEGGTVIPSEEEVVKKVDGESESVVDEKREDKSYESETTSGSSLSHVSRSLLSELIRVMSPNRWTTPNLWDLSDRIFRYLHPIRNPRPRNRFGILRTRRQTHSHASRTILSFPLFSSNQYNRINRRKPRGNRERMCRVEFVTEGDWESWKNQERESRDQGWGWKGEGFRGLVRVGERGVEVM